MFIFFDIKKFNIFSLLIFCLPHIMKTNKATGNSLIFSDWRAWDKDEAFEKLEKRSKFSWSDLLQDRGGVANTASSLSHFWNVSVTNYDFYHWLVLLPVVKVELIQLKFILKM